MGRQSVTGGAVLTVLDAGAARRWAVLARSAFAARRAEIDDLNVYPVPDGDTGTNLFLTIDGALATAAGATDESVPPDLARQSRAFARAMLLTARGNSGVILSQIFRGLADEIESSGTTTLDGLGLARALRRADELAWASVGRPVEGTILSVSRAASRAGALAGDDLPTVVRAVLGAAREALARTPSQLPALARAGVVDAGGTGYVVLLEALEHVVGADASTDPAHVAPSRRRRTEPRPSPDAPASPPSPVAPSCDLSILPGDTDTYAPPGGSPPSEAEAEAEYEVMYLLDDSDDDRVGTLRSRLDELGDSVVVVGEGGRWTVHVHVAAAFAVGAVLEAGIEAGRPHRIAVTRFADLDAPAASDPAASAPAASAPAASAPAVSAPAASAPDASAPDALAPEGSPADRRRGCAVPSARTGSAVVACAAGEGLAALFASAGAQVVPSAPRRRASAGQLLDAVRATGALEVLLLPNDGDTVLAADAAAEVAAEDGVTVRVVAQAQAAVQGLAALAVWSPQAGLDDNTAAMGAAAAATRRASVTVANRDGETSAGPCRAGDVLGLVDGEVVLVGHDLPTVAIAVVTRLLAQGGELVTLVVGELAPAGLAEAVEVEARRTRTGVEVTRVYGGQPVFALFVGVE